MSDRVLEIADKTKDELIEELESWDQRFDGPRTILQNMLEILEDSLAERVGAIQRTYESTLAEHQRLEERQAEIIKGLERERDEANRQLDPILDVLGIADTDREPAGAVKEWITRAEAAEQHCAAFVAELRNLSALASAYAGDTGLGQYHPLWSAIEKSQRALASPPPSSKGSEEQSK